MPDIRGADGRQYAILGEDAEFVDVLDNAPDDLVDQFVSMWEEGQHRDLSRRDLPKVLGEEMQAIFAGERTWGDGPEYGSAWGICEMMDDLGLLDLVGVL